jgi:hypothetical protein
MLQRLARPTMVLAMDNKHEAAVLIPAGKVVDVVPSHEDDRFVVLSVDGEQFLAFASDVRAGQWPFALRNDCEGSLLSCRLDSLRTFETSRRAVLVQMRCRAAFSTLAHRGAP